MQLIVCLFEQSYYHQHRHRCSLSTMACSGLLSHLHVTSVLALHFLTARCRPFCAEWSKHGTCTVLSEPAYLSAALQAEQALGTPSIISVRSALLLPCCPAFLLP